MLQASRLSSKTTFQLTLEDNQDYPDHYLDTLNSPESTTVFS